MTEGIAASALENLADLKTPAEEIKWLPASDKKPSLAYIDARYVMRVLDSRLVGPANWQCQYLFGPDAKVACGIGIKVDGEWLWKWDGAGETDIEGEKGSFSDAFKRAAVRWGIARDLYSLGPRSQAGTSASSAPATRPSPAQAPAGEGSKPVCPYHGKELRYGKYGWYCSGTGGDGPLNKKGYCDWKPE